MYGYKRYGTTIVKDTHFIDPKDIDFEIKESVTERSAKKIEMKDCEKNIRGSYIKTHYRKLLVNNPKYIKGETKKSTRNVNIEDLDDADDQDISFDQTGQSTTKSQKILDREGNVLSQEILEKNFVKSNVVQNNNMESVLKNDRNEFEYIEINDQVTSQVSSNEITRRRTNNKNIE